MGRNSELLRIKYRDGEMLTVAELVKLHPDLNANLIRMRILKYGKDDIETIIAPRKVQHWKDRIKPQGLGPRKDVTTLQSPTEYEKRLWGF